MDQYILSQYGDGFLIAVLFLGIGLILAAIYVGLLKANGRFISVFYLSIINLVVSLWIGSESKAIELFIPKWFPIAEVKIISLYFTGLIIFIFFLEVLECKRIKIIYYLLNIYAVFIVMSTILHCFNLIHFVQSIFIFHTIILCGIIFFIYYSFIEMKRKNVISKYILLYILLLAISAAADIFSYYITYGQESSNFFRISLLLFSIIFSIVLGKEVFSLYNEDVKIKVYKELAYKDALTGIGNRASFHNRMSDIAENVSKYTVSKFFLFDLNNLKSVNDNLGHDKGDYYIKEVSTIIKSTFEHYGYIYRIGGDEFVFISNKEFNEKEAIELMQEKCGILKKQFKGIEIGIAYGQSKIVTDGNTDPYVSYTMADKKMYEKKRKMKKG